ncbi:MAG: toprim domain-containing protein, partial [Muribaculaceae bacterium]|nr:toprim domain-containing protein [Muribaculaceae bacterium]
GQNGDLYDKYRGRVIFPIMNSSGKTVGFGGRDLKGSKAKYINSPESVLYHKNNELYGIYQAKNEIVRQDNCFLVEGYLDVISMWQSGLKNVVASSGTSLTDGQIATIHRFTSNITLLYDGDAAGIKAALRGIDMLLSHKMKVSVLLLPDGHDPDSFAKANTPEQLKEYVDKNSCDIVRFKINVLMKEIGDDPRKKAEVVNSVVESIACIPDYVDRMIYVGECSRRLDVDEQAIAAAVERARNQKLRQMRLDRERRELYRRYPDDKAAEPAPGNLSAATSSSDAQGLQSGVQQSALSGDASAAPDSQSGSSDTVAAREAGLIESIRKNEVFRRNPMKPLEKRLIELIVKYGYLEMPPNDDAQDQSVPLPPANVGNPPPADEDNAEPYFILDFIADELAADKVEFSVPEYKSVYDLLLNTIEDYIMDLREEKAKVAASIDEKRREGHIGISASGGSLSDIERAEIKLENDLEQEYNQAIRDFARLYPGNLLASHEDDAVRSVANDVIVEKYVLSKIYSAVPADTRFCELEEVVRAITEWKSEILNEMLHNLMAELRDLSKKLDENMSEEECPVSDNIPSEEIMPRMRMIQQKISSIMLMRSQIAKDIGERVLCPRKIK